MAGDNKKQRKASLGGKSKPVGLLRNWAHQGFFYLDNTERFGRVLLEIVPTVLLAYMFSHFSELSLKGYCLWLASLVIVHTLNWIINDNWWACVIFAFPKLKNPGVMQTRDYLKKMQIRLANDTSITGAMLYGSVARRVWHKRSDLDLRILREKGLLNGIIAYQVLIRERLIAVFARQPLDIYLADDVNFLMRMRKDEDPVFLKKQDLKLNQLYPVGEEVEEFSFCIK